MTCADCRENLGAFLDRELPPDEMAQVEDHIETCADCSAAHRQMIQTSSRIKAGLIRYEAPDVLKARIRASLGERTSEVRQRYARPLIAPGAWRPLAIAAGIVAIVSSIVTSAVLDQRKAADSVQQQVLASHIRSLMPGHLTDIASNDQHNVKPWFNGRVNISPDVPRLDSLGFPLVGGRLDYVDGRNVAVVVYTRRQHVINVFYWPAETAEVMKATTASSNGYHLIRSRHNGLDVWIVSDLNLGELETFASLLQTSR